MIAVFKHEISTHFTNVMGYVFGGFVLLFTGIFTMVYNLNAAYPNFEYVYTNVAFIYLIAVPMITMKVFAEEKRQKTDQLLYSLPLSMTKVVIGKYLALVTVLIIPAVITLIYPVVLTAFGNVHLPVSFAAALAFLLLGASLLSMGMYISTVTESQAVAAGLCFVVMLINYWITNLASYVSTTAFASLTAFIALAIVVALLFHRMTQNGIVALSVCAVILVAVFGTYIYDSTMFEGLFAAFIEQLSLFERFYTFVDGVFDVTGIVYYLSVIAIFLFLTVQSLEKRRWS